MEKTLIYNQIGGAVVPAPPRSYRPTSTPQIDRLSPLYLRVSGFFKGRFTSEMSSTLCVVVVLRRRRPAGQASNRRAQTGFGRSKKSTYLPQKKICALASGGSGARQTCANRIRALQEIALPSTKKICACKSGGSGAQQTCANAIS